MDPSQTRHVQRLEALVLGCVSCADCGRLLRLSHCYRCIGCDLWRCPNCAREHGLCKEVSEC